MYVKGDLWSHANVTADQICENTSIGRATAQHIITELRRMMPNPTISVNYHHQLGSILTDLDIANEDRKRVVEILKTVEFSGAPVVDREEYIKQLGHALDAKEAHIGALITANSQLRGTNDDLRAENTNLSAALTNEQTLRASANSLYQQYRELEQQKSARVCDLEVKIAGLLEIIRNQQKLLKLTGELAEEYRNQFDRVIQDSHDLIADEVFGG
jgi:hypothetical protein